MKISVLRNIYTGPEDVDIIEEFELMTLSDIRLELQELREEGQSKLADVLERRFIDEND